jgi:hypothetical protein
MRHKHAEEQQRAEGSRSSSYKNLSRHRTNTIAIAVDGTFAEQPPADRLTIRAALVGVGDARRTQPLPKPSPGAASTKKPALSSGFLRWAILGSNQ